MQWAPAELRNDREVVLAAVRQDGDALYCASAALQEDPLVRLYANRSPSERRRARWRAAALAVRLLLRLRRAAEAAEALAFETDWKQQQRGGHVLTSDVGANAAKMLYHIGWQDGRASRKRARD